MPKLCETEGLTDVEQQILATARQFIEDKVLPVAGELEHRDEYPAAVVAAMTGLGIFGLTIPEECGGFELGIDDAHHHESFGKKIDDHRAVLFPHPRLEKEVM